MSQTLEQVWFAVSALPKGEKARLVSTLIQDIQDSSPGIDHEQGTCGGAARIVRTRIPVWTIQAARRFGMSEAEILQTWPSLRAEDLSNAWTYARLHSEEIERAILENQDG